MCPIEMSQMCPSFIRTQLQYIIFEKICYVTFPRAHHHYFFLNVLEKWEIYSNLLNSEW